MLSTFNFRLSTFTSLQELDHDQRITGLDEGAVLRGDVFHAPGPVGLDLIEHLHRFDNAHRLALSHDIADGDERRRIRRGGAVEDADEGARTATVF